MLSGVAASAVAASVSEEGAKERERLLFVSAVSKPQTIVFLLINLLTPPYHLHFGGRWMEAQLTNGELITKACGLIGLCLPF